MLPPAIILGRRIGLPWTDYIGSVWPTLASAGAMVAVLAVVRRVILPLHWNPAIDLAVQVAAGAAAYAGVLLGFFREKIWRYVRFVRGLRSGAQTV
jgi:hypothetical protein